MVGTKVITMEALNQPTTKTDSKLPFELVFHKHVTDGLVTDYLEPFKFTITTATTGNQLNTSEHSKLGANCLQVREAVWFIFCVAHFFKHHSKKKPTSTKVEQLKP
jgi:hypothetical protein